MRDGPISALQRCQRAAGLSWPSAGTLLAAGGQYHLALNNLHFPGYRTLGGKRSPRRPCDRMPPANTETLTDSPSALFGLLKPGPDGVSQLHRSQPRLDFARSRHRFHWLTQSPSRNYPAR